MIKPFSKNRPTQPLNDFQVLKGKCERTMQPFGQPVSATHEARLLIRDDQQKLAAETPALYVIHQRSANRIVGIARKPPVRSSIPLPKAA